MRGFFFPQHPAGSSLIEAPGAWKWLVGTWHLGRRTAGEMSCQVHVKVKFEPR